MKFPLTASTRLNNKNSKTDDLMRPISVDCRADRANIPLHYPRPAANWRATTALMSTRDDGDDDATACCDSMWDAFRLLSRCCCVHRYSSWWCCCCSNCCWSTTHNWWSFAGGLCTSSATCDCCCWCSMRSLCRWRCCPMIVCLHVILVWFFFD